MSTAAGDTATAHLVLLTRDRDPGVGQPLATVKRADAGLGRVPS